MKHLLLQGSVTIIIVLTLLMLCYVMLCYFPYVTPIIKEVWPVIKEQCPLDNLLLLCWVPVSSYFNKLRRDVI